MFFFRKFLITFTVFLVISAALFFYYSFRKNCENKFILRNGSVESRLYLEKRSDSLYVLQTITNVSNKSQISQWSLPYPVYKIDTGDVNHDGKTDILVGVIKATRFFPEKDKRLFIFQLKDNLIRPLWLGSRVAQPLVDFKTCNESGIKVRTIEKESNGNFLVAMYQWQSFGLSFVRYEKRNILLNEAYSLINF